MFSVSRPMARPLDTFKIPPSCLSRLLAHGFATARDFDDLAPTDLAQETGLSLQEAVMILDEVRERNGVPAPR